jgi:hypothetical protein
MQWDKEKAASTPRKSKHAWVDELPSVLWSLRTTPNAATQETPFFLVHGAEAVLSVEITHEASRIAAYVRQLLHKHFRTMSMRWTKQEM